MASENSVSLERESLDRPSARSLVRYFVAANKSKSKAPPAEGGQRRSGRFPILVPVEVRWREPDGDLIKADAQAKEVNIHGGLLQFLDTEVFPPLDTELELTNLFSSEMTKGRSCAIRRSAEGTVIGVAIELLVPSESFWGLTFRLKRTTAELKKLDEVIRSGDIDPRVLREFRDAVDYVRKTAWAVQEWQERQFQHRDTATVLPLLMAERIRRAAQICTAVAADLKNHDIAPETAGLEALFQATLRLYLDLAVLFGNDPAP